MEIIVKIEKFSTELCAELTNLKKESNGNSGTEKHEKKTLDGFSITKKGENSIHFCIT